MNTIKCIRAEIYKNENRDFSNGGLSSKFDTVLIPVKDGCIDVDRDNPPENLVRIVRRNIFGREYVHVEPWGKENETVMAGGTFVYTCDSRFNETINNGGYPVSLHDRQEH